MNKAEKLLDFQIDGNPYGIFYVEEYVPAVQVTEYIIGMYKIVDGSITLSMPLTRTNVAHPLWIPPGQTEPRDHQWYIDDVIRRANEEIEEIWSAIENPTPPTPEEQARREIVDAVKAALSVSYDSAGKPIIQQS